MLLYFPKVTRMRKIPALIMMPAAAAGLSANDSLDNELILAAIDEADRPPRGGISG